MPAVRPRTAWIAGLLVSAVAVSVLNGTQAGAVVGEKDKDGSYAFTARLDIGDGQRGCSAALVAPQWLVTAASCFADNPAQSYKVAPGAPKLPAKAFIGGTDLAPNSGSEAQVVELVPRDDRDLVMAKLAKPVTGTAPVNLGTQAPIVGEDLWLTGYGRTKDEWVPDRVHYGQFTVDKAENTTFSLASKASGATACKGDTGGPALRNVGGRYELVGINSRSWQGGCLGGDPKETRTGGVGTRVDDVAGWVRELVNRKEPVSNTPVDANIDFNGDGKADYLIVEDNGAVRAFINDGGDKRGGWTNYGTIAKGAGAPGSKIRFADINGDRKADYLIVEDNGAVRAFINDGGDGRGGWTNYGTIATGTGDPASKIRFADINGDGKADYLIVEDNGAVRAFINDGGDKRGGWTNYGTIATGTGDPASKIHI
ncbi:trypsin-like serine protease [Streptomyces sp. NRRL B-1677]|uniref:trypsin-like serine protease n=1 Tax=Streptomyces sp. NRRL B-1677 TaxID=2682966 RepID=UPI001892AD23|nr:trypsin-like serine protease [Streptomyces sp. NRRL B-1677]MBF6045526.1 trypsin-like serine protease [Streptomyces sp. NRRL B-1677]